MRIEQQCRLSPLLSSSLLALTRSSLDVRIEAGSTQRTYVHTSNTNQRVDRESERT